MTFVFWPKSVLRPARVMVNPVPFSRSGGRTLGGMSRNVRTDLGYWSIVLENMPIHSKAQRKCINAIRAEVSGRAGLIVIPVWSQDTSPYENGFAASPESVHEDSSTFGGGSSYRGSEIVVKMYAAAAIGDTSVHLEIIKAEADLTGVRFSYQYALYETGPAINIAGNVWTVPLTTSVRAPIPAGALLEFDHPNCLCRLAADDGLNISLNVDNFDHMTVAFTSADDYWSDLAAGLIE